MPNNKELNQYLVETQTRLDGALHDDEIRDRLRPFGYDEAAIQELLDVMEETRLVYRDHVMKYAAQYQATDAFYDALAVFDETFRHHRRVARVAFEASEAGYAVLRLAPPMARTYDAIVRQAQALYGGVLQDAEVAERLAGFSLTPGVAEEALAELEALEALKAEQRRRKNAALASTQERDRAFADLRKRRSDFLEIVRIATADCPQLRESMGIVTP